MCGGGSSNIYRHLDSFFFYLFILQKTRKKLCARTEVIVLTFRVSLLEVVLITKHLFRGVNIITVLTLNPTTHGIIVSL